MLFVDGLELGRGRGRHKPRDHEPVDSGHRLVQRVRIFGVDNHDGVLCGWCVCVGTCVRALWVRVCGSISRRVMQRRPTATVAAPANNDLAAMPSQLRSQAGLSALDFD